MNSSGLYEDEQQGSAEGYNLPNKQLNLAAVHDERLKITDAAKQPGNAASHQSVKKIKGMINAIRLVHQNLINESKRN